MKFAPFSCNERVLEAVQLLLRGTHIGEGSRDQGRLVSRYTQLVAAHVWRMENPLVQQRYALEVRVQCRPALATFQQQL